MKPRPLLACSILLNLLFFGAALWWLAGQPDAVTPSVASPAAPSPAVVPATATPFRWSQLEAGDYPTYIGNLRSIGCPEETIRDIITADVASQYEEKRRQILAADTRQPEGASLASSPVLAAAKPANAVPEPASGNTADIGSGAHPIKNPRAALTLEKLAQEQATVLVFLLSSPAAKAAPESAAATPPGAPAADTNASQVTPTAQPVASMNSQPQPVKDRRQRGLLTHEQEVLRAKIGFQAFYYTTKEDNDRVRAGAEQ